MEFGLLTLLGTFARGEKSSVIKTSGWKPMISNLTTDWDITGEDS